MFWSRHVSGYNTVQTQNRWCKSRFCLTSFNFFRKNKKNSAAHLIELNIICSYVAPFSVFVCKHALWLSSQQLLTLPRLLSSSSGGRLLLLSPTIYKQRAPSSGRSRNCPARNYVTTEPSGLSGQKSKKLQDGENRKAALDFGVVMKFLKIRSQA